jgi:hypothetical protein
VEVNQPHGHGHGHGHGIFILATHPEGIWTTNPRPSCLKGRDRQPQQCDINLSETQPQTSIQRARRQETRSYWRLLQSETDITRRMFHSFVQQTIKWGATKLLNTTIKVYPTVRLLSTNNDDEFFVSNQRRCLGNRGKEPYHRKRDHRCLRCKKDSRAAEPISCSLRHHY